MTYESRIVRVTFDTNPLVYAHDLEHPVTSRTRRGAPAA